MISREAVAFFREHGSFMSRPGEPEAEARERCALESARAEAEASDRGWFTEWQIDPEATAEEGRPQWRAFICAPGEYSSDPAEVLAVIGAVDFAEDYDVTPEGDPRARVTAADLAAEALAEMTPEPGQGKPAVPGDRPRDRYRNLEQAIGSAYRRCRDRGGYDSFTAGQIELIISLFDLPGMAYPFIKDVITREFATNIPMVIARIEGIPVEGSPGWPGTVTAYLKAEGMIPGTPGTPAD